MKNLPWIDVLKGIGITFVVAGHIYIGDASKYIYLFHMPLFFFVGGYLFTIKQDNNEYIKDKFRHLIIPYFSFLVLLFFIPLILKILLSSDMSIDLFLKEIVKGIIGGKFLGGITGVFWFVTVFFFTQQMMNYLLVKFSLTTTGFIIFIFLLLSYINSLYYPEYWLPLNMNVVLASMPLFFIGYMVKVKEIHFKKLFVVSIFTTSLVSLHLGYHNTYDMKYLDYGLPFITLISSLSCILVLIYISKVFATTRYIYIFFKELGLASMIIMYLHQPIQIILNLQNVMNGNETVRFIGALGVSYFLFLLFSKYSVTKTYLLGQKRLEVNYNIKRKTV